MQLRVRWFRVTVCGFVLTSACSAAGVASDGRPVVVDHVDGDTIVVRLNGHDEHMRLIGIDTPETKHPTKPVECYGPEAAAFTAGLLPEGTVVRIERDVEPRDHFGRLLVYLYRAADGVFVNAELARQGLARPLEIAPNDAHSVDLLAASREARSARRGIWHACEPQP